MDVSCLVSRLLLCSGYLINKYLPQVLTARLLQELSKTSNKGYSFTCLFCALQKEGLGYAVLLRRFSQGWEKQACSAHCDNSSVLKLVRMGAEGYLCDERLAPGFQGLVGRGIRR